MFVPVPTSSPAAQDTDEPRDMAVALRLLSGKDCERDADRAHVMLVRLSESRDGVVSEEASRVLKAGVSNGWFREQAPKHYELEKIAEKSLAKRNSKQVALQRSLLIGIGLAAMFGGLVAFFVNADSAGDWLGGQVIIGGIIVVMLIAMVLFKASGRS